MLAFRISRELYTVAEDRGYENRACVYTIFFNLGRRGRSIDVALIHDGALDRERNVLPPFHPDIHPRSDFHSRLRRKREKRTQSRLKNG